MDPIALDNLNRNLGGVINSLQALQNAISSATTGTPTKVGDSKSADELNNLMTKFVKDHKDSMDQQSNYLQEIVRAMNEGKKIKGERSARGQGAQGAQRRERRERPRDQNQETGKGTAQFQESVDKLIKKLGPKAEYVKENINQAVMNLVEARKIDDKMSLRLADLNEQQQELVLKEAKKLTLSKGQSEAYINLRNQLYKIQDYGETIKKSLGFQNNLTEGMVEKEVEFTKEIRAAAYETAGVTRNSRSLQKAYEDIGNTVKETGVNRTEFQKSYMTALKSGVKDLKQASAITKTQLNTEKQLGLEAGSLQENFQNMAQSGRMTNNQIDEVGRAMRDVAKSTGMTGNALKGAVESSSGIIENLRNAATLTAQATRNVIEMNANAKKLGVASQMQNLQTNLSSSAKLILESSSESKNLIFMAASKVGKLQDALNGTLLSSQEGIQSFGKGMESILKNFGVESVESIDQLSAEAKKNLNLQLKTTVGMELGEFRNLLEATKESGKGLGDRLSDINKKLNQNVTTEEKKALMEQQRQLKASKQLQILTALDEAAKGASNMGEALNKFSERRGEFEKDLEALGTNWKDSSQVARDSKIGRAHV